MKILLVSQYFWPESFIINDLIKSLVKQGHQIKVLTGKPNYPEGTIYPGYEEKGCVQEDFIEGVSVYRVPLRPRGKGGAKNLFFNYCSFIVNGLRYFPQAIKGETYDVMLVMAISPITSVIPAIALKTKTKAHLSVWIQDLWPESLKATGFIKNRFLLSMIGLVVRGIYFFSDTLLVQSEGFIVPVSRYAKRDKIIYYPNSYQKMVKVEQPLPEGLQQTLNQYCCFVFAGNIGKAQSIETLIEAAKQLQHLPLFRLVIVGNGSMFDWVLQEKNKCQLDNVILTGRFPASTMPQIFEKAAGLLVSLTKNDIFSYTIPSKIQAYLAAGRPIIASLNGEGAKVIQEARAGLSSAAEDVDALVANITTIYHMTTAERNQLGQAGHAYFLKHFEMEKQALQLIDILNERINAK